MYEMLVYLPVIPGRTQELVDLMSTVMPRVRTESGCTRFSVFLGDEPDTVWLEESYVSKQYHDDVHEAFPEIQQLLRRIPSLLTGPYVVRELQPALEL